MISAIYESGDKYGWSIKTNASYEAPENPVQSLGFRDVNKPTYDTNHYN
jgi:hypothetical protein